MAEALCRRCRGNLFVFATEALPGRREQAIDKFGRGFWPYESGLHALGGRWTDGCGWAYVFTRIPARRVRLSFWSGFPKETQFTLLISLYDPLADGFPAPAAAFPFSGRENGRDELEAAFAFLPGRLYRLEIRSPHFFPGETPGNDDQRRLGLAIFSLTILA